MMPNADTLGMLVLGTYAVIDTNAEASR